MSDTSTGYVYAASKTVWGWMGSLGSSLGTQLGTVLTYITSPEGLGQDTGKLELGETLEPIEIRFPCFPPAGLKDRVKQVLAKGSLIDPGFADVLPGMDLAIKYDTPRGLAEKVQQHQVRDELNEWLKPQVAEAERLMLGFFENQVNSAEALEKDDPGQLPAFLGGLPDAAKLLETFARSLKADIEKGAGAELESIYQKYAGNVQETCARNRSITVGILTNTAQAVSGAGGILTSGLTGGISGVLGVAGILNSVSGLRNAYNDYHKSIEAVQKELETDLVSLGNTVHVDCQGFKEVLLKLVDGTVGDIRKLVESGAKVTDGVYREFGLEVENKVGQFYQGLFTTTGSTEDRLKQLQAKTGEIQQASNLAMNSLDKLLESKSGDEKEFEELFEKISKLNVEIKGLVSVIGAAEQRLQAFQERIAHWKDATSFADVMGVAFNFGAGMFDFETYKFKLPDGDLETLGALGGAPGLLAAPWGDAVSFAKAALMKFAELTEQFDG